VQRLNHALKVRRLGLEAFWAPLPHLATSAAAAAYCRVWPYCIWPYCLDQQQWLEFISNRTQHLCNAQNSAYAQGVCCL
jgi:hypothetical protein